MNLASCAKCKRGESAYTDEQIEALATEADATIRSVERRLLGLPVRGRAGARVDRVLAAHGLARSHAA